MGCMKHRKTLMEQALTPLGERLDQAGITADYLIKKLQEELDAEFERVFCTKEGKIKYSKKMINWSTRQEARKDAHKLRKDYPVEKTETELGGLIMLAPEKIKKPKNSGK